MTRGLPALEVDRRGLAQLLARYKIERAVLELVQNALDERVTRVEVTLKHVGRGRHRVRVADDSPEGFADLRHAYTLFASSAKKGDVAQRGRFNFGEKLFLSLASWARVTTTTGAWEWAGDSRRRLRRSTAVGSVVEGDLPMTRAEAARTRDAIRRVLVPAQVELRLDGERVASRDWEREITLTLATEVADAEGRLVKTRRRTSVRLHAVREGEVATLYELGLPVVELDAGDPWHLDVQQKVPLTLDRDNVPPAYLRALRVAVLDATADTLDDERVAAAWVGEALESPDVSVEAVRSAITARYGERVVIRDPSDPEANRLAVSRGYTVIEPRAHSRAAWESIRRAEAAKPAGQVTPSPRPYDPDGRPLQLIPAEEWSAAERWVAQHAVALARALIDRTLHVEYTRDGRWPYAAAYSRAEAGLVVNLSRVGRGWCSGPLEAIHAVLIHEMAHEYESDHLSSRYYDACCQLGARLAALALRQPRIFEREV